MLKYIDKNKLNAKEVFFNMKKCFNCGIDFDMVLYTMSNSTDNSSVCANCAVIGLDSISIKGDESFKCELCGKDGHKFTCTDMDANLCMEHTKKLINLNLNTIEFKKLYKQNKDAFLLHDDFYCPDTGIALQPRR